MNKRMNLLRDLLILTLLILLLSDKLIILKILTIANPFLPFLNVPRYIRVVGYMKL